jgi:hypothetical protein
VATLNNLRGATNRVPNGRSERLLTGRQPSLDGYLFGDLAPSSTQAFPESSHYVVAGHAPMVGGNRQAVC